MEHPVQEFPTKVDLNRLVLLPEETAVPNQRPERPGATEDRKRLVQELPMRVRRNQLRHRVPACRWRLLRARPLIRPQVRRYRVRLENQAPQMVAALPAMRADLCLLPALISHLLPSRQDLAVSRPTWMVQLMHSRQVPVYRVQQPALTRHWLATGDRRLRGKMVWGAVARRVGVSQVLRWRALASRAVLMMSCQCRPMPRMPSGRRLPARALRPRQQMEVSDRMVQRRP